MNPKCYDTRYCVLRANGRCKILEEAPHKDGKCSFAKRLKQGKTYQRKHIEEDQDNRPFFMKWPYLGRFR